MTTDQRHLGATPSSSRADGPMPTGRRRTLSRVWRAAVLASVGLCLVLLLVERGSGDPPIEPATHGGHTHGIETTTLSADVDSVLRTRGTVAALDRLDELTAAGAVSPGSQHQTLHEVGRRSFGYAGGDVRSAFAACEIRFDGGCFHGVLQAYFTADPQLALAQLPRTCTDVVVAPDVSPLLRYQCLHGLGHGLAIAFPGDPRGPLGRCDTLATPADQADCHGGVFMEHIVTTVGHPGYSCASVPQRYGEQCYLLASASALLRNGRDVAAAFAECDAAPRRFVPACYTGMGRDIAGMARGDAARITEQCALGRSAHRARCLEGAAKLLVSRRGAARDGLAFCVGVSVPGRAGCVEYVGRLLYALHPRDMGLRAQECAAGGPAALEPCRLGAGVT